MPRHFYLLLLCFTGSGMSGLIYEVAWVRSLELIFGTTTFAVATVLAAFMGGLALGSYSMGRAAHRIARHHPLIVYGVIECVIGGFALFIPELFKFLVPIYQSVWSHFHASFVWFSLLRFLLCTAILLAPTFFMGATLPIMSAYVGHEAGGNGDRKIGLLYAFNTAGAVLGCAAAGLVFFPWLGLAQTQWVAVGLNFAAAAGAFLLARADAGWRLRAAPAETAARSAPSNRAASAEEEPGHVPDESPSRLAGDFDLRRRSAWLLVLIYAVSGFCAMLYEVAWSRVLVLVLGSSTYAYTVMLTTFLLGLALGAFAAARLFSRTAYPLITAGLCQVLIALTTYLGLFLVEELPYFYSRIHALLNPSARGVLGVQFILAMGLMILPTLGLGAMFPITIRGLNPVGERTARVVGWAYALNTTGAILGSILAGFWLVPQLGSRNTLLLGIVLSAGLGVLAIVKADLGPLARHRRGLAALVSLFGASVIFGAPAWHPSILSSGIFRYVRNYSGLGRAELKTKLRENRGQVLFFDEGLTCTITICRSLSSLSLLINGKPDASVPSGMVNPYEANLTTNLADLPTQILLGQVPLLLAPKQDEVLVIGLGSGVTLSSVLRHPVKAVECIELEKAVVQASHFFETYSGRPLEDPRVKMIVNDARNHLLVTDQRYDVMISEPSNPWIAGVASLFTRDFFEIAKSKLRPDGVFCQWVQLYELSQADFEAILRTFSSVFPNAHLFRDEDDAFVIGRLQPGGVDLTQIQARLTAAVLADLARIEIHRLEDFLTHYWIGGQELARALSAGPLNTDDNMLIEFRAPLTLQARTEQEKGAQRQTLLNLFRDRGTGLISHGEPVAINLPDRARWWAGLAEAALNKQQPAAALNYARHSLNLHRNPLAAQVSGDALAQAGQRELARAWWIDVEREFPNAPEVLRSIAVFHSQEGNWTAAGHYAKKWLAEKPDDPRGRYLLGKSHYYLKDWQNGIAMLEPLASLARTNEILRDLPYWLGQLYWNQNRNEDAVQQLQRFLTLQPQHPNARSLLADALARLGRSAEAASQRQRLNQKRSPEADDILAKGIMAWEQKQPRAALSQFEQAWRLNPWDDEINFYLARARKQAGQIAESVLQLEQYLSAHPDRPWAIGFLSQLLDQQGETLRARHLANYFYAATGQPWKAIREEF